MIAAKGERTGLTWVYYRIHANGKIIMEPRMTNSVFICAIKAVAHFYCELKEESEGQ